MSNSQPPQPVRPPQWLYKLRQSGLQQIEQTLVQVRGSLQHPSLSLWDQLFWQGRQRELLMARWFVNHLLPVEVIIESSPEEQDIDTETALIPENESSLIPTISDSSRSQLWELSLKSLHLGIDNRTNLCLEIDILQPLKRRELFYLILKEWEQVLEELRFLEINFDELIERRALILRNLWQASTLNFITKYYNPSQLSQNYPLLDLLLKDGEIVQQELLDKIPLIMELFEYLLFDHPLTIDNVPYRVESPEAKDRAEIILHNMVVHIANGVVQFLLNYFTEVEVIKHNLYLEMFRSSREIAQFRNQLSWRYRKEKYFDEPKAIFESQYRVFSFQDEYLRIKRIYAPRTDELKQLQGLPWMTTIILEFRDAIAPRLREMVALLGNGTVYVLTQVIGRAIGLIGRGILQGIGTNLPDTSYNKEEQRRK